MALARRCLDCGQRARGTRCPRCEASRRGTTTERGYGHAHRQRARAAVTAQPWCSTCGSTDDLTADHLAPLARGGHPLGPLRVLCRSCKLAPRQRCLKVNGLDDASPPSSAIIRSPDSARREQVGTRRRRGAPMAAMSHVGS